MCQFLINIKEDLSPKFRSKTHDYLITAIISVVKEKLAYATKIEKQLALEEKALVN
jgi:hypothetical protein